LVASAFASAQIVFGAVAAFLFVVRVGGAVAGDIALIVCQLAGSARIRPGIIRDGERGSRFVPARGLGPGHLVSVRSQVNRARRAAVRLAMRHRLAIGIGIAVFAKETKRAAAFQAGIFDESASVAVEANRDRVRL
jgi:hypothetical protein